jgi:hypothetical protein
MKNGASSACAMVVAWLSFAAAGDALAAPYIKGDVTALLGPTFFVDDAAPGGSDATTHQPASGSFTRSFSGLLTANQGATTIEITGFGFATLNNASANDATSLTSSFTYLGADGAVGGGDDVVVGSATGSYAYNSHGEYSCVFDAPLSATLNITAVKFLITVTPSNATATGSVSFKVGSVPYDGITGAKLSVAGVVAGALPAQSKRVNLAKFQVTTASSVNGQYLADYATDGVVGNLNSWRSANVNTSHWVEIALPGQETIRSAHAYLGIDEGPVPASFKFQYHNGSSWFDAPGSLVTANTAHAANVIFSSAVTASRFRFFTDADGTQRVRELALFPPNPAPGSGVEQGFPLGTDVELNLARERPAVASAVNGANYAKLAVDGYVSSASKWQTTTVGVNMLDIDLRVASKIGSAHLYSGDGSIPPLADFALQYWDGTSWVNIPGGVVTGNTQETRVIDFTTDVTTSQVRLTFSNSGTSAVRELCVFGANTNLGHAVGQDITATAPLKQSYEQFNNAYYHLVNRSADLPMRISGSSAVIDTAPADENLSHYQVLLNVGTDTFRLRNRSTGRCLSGGGLSSAPGATLLDENYTALPYQNWRLVAVDATDYYLINEWSGLVVDTAGAAIGAGTALVQQTLNGTPTQHWRVEYQTHYPKKGMAGFADRAVEFKAHWVYNWSRSTTANLPLNIAFHPMQWGDFNWDIGSNQGPIDQFISRWRRDDRALHLLGFNEPDGDEQANLSVTEVITLWPRLEKMNFPLVSPVTVNPDNAWMNDFMTQAEARGYRMDAIAAHNYPSPSGGDPSSLINLLQTFSNDWDRPVWLTEFSTVNWSGTGTWTEEDNYNWLAEFLWRAESLPWLRQYALFLFSGTVPTNPWDAVGPRSNAYLSDGTTPTAFGELYFAWDCDATIRSDKAYFMHNKAERKRVQNAVSSTGPTARWIRDGTNVTQWVLRPSPTAGQYYVTSLRDGRRLRYTGSALNFAAAHTTGTQVQWTLVADQHGWFYVENPAAPTANRRLRDAGSSYGMVSNTNTTDSAKWRFIVPYAAVETEPPAALTGLTATPGNTQVSLAWTASSAVDFSFYTVLRSATSGGPYTQVASNLTNPSYLNTGLTNGTTYHYVVTATDTSGYQSTISSQASATPFVVPAAPTGLAATAGDAQIVLNWTVSSIPNFAFYKVYRSTTNGGPYTQIATNLTSPSYTNSSLVNGTAYYYVVTVTNTSSHESTNSAQTSATPIHPTPPAGLGMSSSGADHTLSWPASHRGWILEMQVQTLTPSGWTAVAGSSAVTSHTVHHTTSSPRTFYRLRRP